MTDGIAKDGKEDVAQTLSVRLRNWSLMHADLLTGKAGEDVSAFLVTHEKSARESVLSALPELAAFNLMSHCHQVGQRGEPQLIFTIGEKICLN